MPLDEDFLSILDLFELRSSALEACHLASHDMDDEDDEDDARGEAGVEGQKKREEARGLLRGILHGCEPLLAMLADHRIKSTTPEGSADADEQQQRVVKLRALGLSPRYPLRSESYLAYLQAVSLHELASVLDKQEPIDLAAGGVQNLLKSDRGGKTQKKRKVQDLNEPTNPGEWLDESLNKYERAREMYVQATAAATKGDAKAQEDEEEEEDNKMFGLFDVLLLSDHSRAIIDRQLFLNATTGSSSSSTPSGQPAAKKQKIDTAHSNSKMDVYELLQGTYYAPGVELINARLGSSALHRPVVDFVNMYADLVVAFFASVKLSVTLLESSVSTTNTATMLKYLERLKESLALVKLPTTSTAETVAEDEDEETEQLLQSWAFELQMCIAQVELVKFVLVEEEVEEKYRPDDEDEDEETGEDEGEIKLLPVGEEDVVKARRCGEQGRFSLWSDEGSLSKDVDRKHGPGVVPILFY